MGSSGVVHLAWASLVVAFRAYPGSWVAASSSLGASFLASQVASDLASFLQDLIQDQMLCSLIGSFETSISIKCLRSALIQMEECTVGMKSWSCTCINIKYCVHTVKMENHE